MPLDGALVRRIDAAADLEHCHRVLAVGSRSFAAAARILPRRVRAPATVVYAYCRCADDVIDTGGEPQLGLRHLRRQLDRVFAGRPHDDPIERALASVIESHALPRAPFDALLEGFAWDAARRPILDEGDLVAYSVRVAGTVGVIMSALMGARERDVLARACDLGVAMQLTNIARDVGEDARRGRVYLPQWWLDEENCSAEALRGGFDPMVGRVVERVLARADVAYRGAEAGIEALPVDCRAAIRAAASIYADIGRTIRARGCDSITTRAYTTWWRKAVLLWRARRAAQPLDRDALARPPVPEAAALVAACEAR